MGKPVKRAIFFFFKDGRSNSKCAVGDDSIEKMDALKEGELSMVRVKVSLSGWALLYGLGGYFPSLPGWHPFFLFPRVGSR